MLGALKLGLFTVAGVAASETWHHLPDHTTDAVAICATRSAVPSAGTYTLAFQQSARVVDIDVPERTVSLEDRLVLIVPASQTIHLVPAWTATVATFCAEATVFDFFVEVTKTITITMPAWLLPSDM